MHAPSFWTGWSIFFIVWSALSLRYLKPSSINVAWWPRTFRTLHITNIVVQLLSIALWNTFLSGYGG